MRRSLAAAGDLGRGRHVRRVRGYAGGGPNAEHQSSWAEKLVEWGYVALQVDSYSPRGPSLACDYAGGVTISHDAFSAKSYLSTLPFMDPENIAVMGWSMGGMAALKIKVYRPELET